ncbi:hypothetical protein ABZU45_01370 [Streptomyces avermitilis]
MLTETTGRTAQDLAVELAVLRDADWAALWAGPPQSGVDLERWCGRYGWEPRTSDRQLVVRTGNGGELTFDSGGIWGSPVTSVALSTCWHVKASAPAENGTVLTAAAETWPTYLEAATSALGAPVWAGPWDAPDFPEPAAHQGVWEGRESRLKHRSPYQLAFWGPLGEAPVQALFVLNQSVSFPTWTPDMPGGSTIRMAVHRPVGSRSRL